jgi:hypothetical protein
MMEEMRETQPEEDSLSGQSEQGEFQELDEATTQPEALIERKGNLEVAEGVEKAFVKLMDQTMENLESISLRKEEEEDGEYKVKVKFPWLLDGDEDDIEGVWARVSTLTKDERGTYFMPEISDSVAMDSDQEIPHPEDIQPLEEIDERQYDSQATLYEKKEELYNLKDEGVIGEPSISQEIKDIPDSYLDGLEIYQRDSNQVNKVWLPDEGAIGEPDISQEKKDFPETYLGKTEIYQRDSKKANNGWSQDEVDKVEPHETDEYSYYKEDGQKEYTTGEKSKIEFDDDNTGRGEGSSKKGGSEDESNNGDGKDE